MLLGKRQLTMVLALAAVCVVCAGSLAVADSSDAKTTDDQGSCGDDLTYSFSAKTCTLTISGTGDMYEYKDGKTPWNSYKDKITSIVLESGITSISAKAFKDCNVSGLLQIPSTVTSIGKEAFKGCDRILVLQINCADIVIGEQAFKDCKNIAFVDLYGSDAAICEEAFKNCKKLVQVDLGETSSIGQEAFKDCKNLTYLYIPATVQEIGWNAFKNTDEHISVVDCSNLHIRAGGYTGLDKHAHVTYGDCTVYFDANGGVLVGDRSEYAKFGEIFTFDQTATREGYTFDGWYTSDGKKVTSGNVWEFLKDTTLYAHWTPVDA